MRTGSDAPRAIAAGVFVAALAAAAGAGEETVIHAFRSGLVVVGADKSWGGNSGDALEAAGDVNADGHDDIVVAWPGTPGFVRVFSGADGAILHQFEGPAAEWGFGRAVAGAGDVNGDGFADLIVGSSVKVRVYSGRDGVLMAEFSDANLVFGVSVAGAGDIDGDGSGDVIVGAKGPDFSGSNEPVRAYSVRTGALLLECSSPMPSSNFGSSVAGGEDFNGDGVPDIVVGADLDSTNGFRAGAVYVFSGADGAMLLRLLGVDTGDYLGASVDVMGDVDGDGVAEIVAGTRSCCGSDVYARVWSGATGDLIHHVFSVARIVSGLDDVDGDGVPDFTSHRELHSGATGAVLASFGDQPYDRPIRGAGDVNADGLPDILRMDYGLVFEPTTVNVHWTKFVPPTNSITMHEEGCAPPSGPAGYALPTLQVTGTPKANAVVALTIVGVPPSTTTFLIVGTTAGNLPLNNGCSLLVAPPFDIYAASTSGSYWGFLSRSLRVPPSLPTLVPVVQVQAFTVDPSLFLGYSLTNRVEIVFADG